MKPPRMATPEQVLEQARSGKLAGDELGTGREGAPSALSRAVGDLEARVDRLGGWLEVGAWALLGAAVGVLIATSAVLL